MYTQKDFSNLLGITGFSVTNANKVIAMLDTVEKGSYEYSELKRRLGWEIDGVKLHELYFENMSKEKTEMSENIKNTLIESYGSIEEWEASLKRNGMIRGIGWVALVRDRDTGKIFHTWIGEHNVGNILNADILLVMDCWEHAYMTDYGIKRADYISSFMNAINWEIVEERLNK